MTTAAERLRQSAQKANSAAAAKGIERGGQADQGAAGDSESREPAPPTKSKPAARSNTRTPARQVRQIDVKKTLALSPTMNGELADWQNAAARELGLARVTAQEVLQSLVAELLTEPGLASRVKDRLAANRV